MRYPKDPNGLIRDVTEVNAAAKQLREEGWTVKFNVSTDNSRIWLEVATSRSCDPPEVEA